MYIVIYSGGLVFYASIKVPHTCICGCEIKSGAFSQLVSSGCSVLSMTSSTSYMHIPLNAVKEPLPIQPLELQTQPWNIPDFALENEQ